MASGHGVDKPNKANHPGRQVGRDRLVPDRSFEMGTHPNEGVERIRQQGMKPVIPYNFGR